MHKKLNFISCLLMVVIVGVFVFAGCTNQDLSSVEDQPTKLKIGGHVEMASVVLEVALDRGFFDEENLEVEIERVNSSKVSMAALENGELDLAITSRSAGTFNHLAKNEKLRIVADAQRIVPTIIVRKDLANSIKAIADLEGRTVVTPRVGSTSQYIVVKLLETVGLSLDDIDSKSLKGQEVIAALEAGNIDAATLNEPYVSMAIDKNIGVKLAENEIRQVFHHGQQHGILVASTDFLSDREVAERFFRAYKKAADYYLRAKAGDELERREVTRIIVNYTDAEPEIIEQIDWIDISPDLKPDVEYMKQAQEWYFQNGFLNQQVDLVQKTDLSYLP